MSDEHIITQHGPIQRITLNRPRYRNALTLSMIQSLHESIQSCTANDNVLAIIIDGVDPVFCAGLDITEARVMHTTNDQPHPLVGALYDVLMLIRSIDTPIIAAVQGAAAAGGAALACACDVVLASRTSRFGYPGIHHGISSPLVMYMLTPQIGARRARYLVLTGRMITADEAHKFGMVDDVVDDDQVSIRAMTVAQQMANIDSQAYATAKRYMSQSMHMSKMNMHGATLESDEAQKRLCCQLHLTPD